MNEGSGEAAALTITVLGCSGTWAGRDGACSGYLLRTPTTSVWLDCGSGTLGNLQRHVDLLELDAIVVSHSHPDHWLELPVVLNALRYGLDAAHRELPVLWTAETAQHFEAISSSHPYPTFAPRVVDETSTVTIGDIDLRFSRTDHPVETLAVRAEHGGRAIVYSADTGDGWPLASLGADLGLPIELAVVEATLDETQRNVVQHLTARQAGEQAAMAGVASLVLTHLAPGSDPEARRAEAAAVFDGPVEVAENHRTFTA